MSQDDVTGCMDLIGDAEFEAVEVDDAGEWIREYGAVKIDHEEIKDDCLQDEGYKLVFSVAPDGELHVGKGGRIRCHLGDQRVEPVPNDEIPTYLKMRR